MPKLKICHVITRMNLGGAQENTLLTCKGLIEAGHDVTLVTGLSTGPEGNLLEAMPVPGLQVVTVPELQRAIAPFKDMAAKRILQKLFENGMFDVVHTHMSKAGVIGRLAARKAHVPFIVHTVHGLPFHPFQSPLKNFLFQLMERRAARSCDRIFAVAKSMVDQCVSKHIAPKEKYEVIYSGMNLEAFTSATRDTALQASLGLPENVPVIGMVARMFPQKGYEDFLEVAPRLHEAFPDIRFLLVGDGDMRPEIEAKLTTLGLRDNAIFTGLVPPQDVSKYLPFMDVMLHLSLHEGLPRTVVQACAAERPVVAYGIDGTPEVIDNGFNGYLIAPRQHAKVAEQLCILLHDSQRRKQFGHVGRGKVVARFGIQRMVDSIEKAYFDGLRPKKPAMFTETANRTVRL